jgi:transcriptional regulator with XRE-family HTH domain
MAALKAWVGRNVRAARKAKGLTELQLAEWSGLSADFIGKVEWGTTSLSLESLKAIATALHPALGDLFTGKSASDSSQEALMELIALCQGRTKQDIELLMAIDN